MGSGAESTITQALGRRLEHQQNLTHSRPTKTSKKESRRGITGRNVQQGLLRPVFRTQSKMPARPGEPAGVPQGHVKN